MLRVAIVITGVILLMTAISYAEEVREHRLDNGLTVLLKENHAAPVINLNVVYRVGSKYERPGITGISHLLEHMMFKTSENLPLGEFDQRLKAVGADNNAYTWLDQTVYYELIAADQVDVALELEAERMRGLLCLKEDHELEMTVVRNELEQRDDAPFTLLYEELLSFAFKAHPYAVPTIGWVDDVEGITAADIKQYYDTFYQPDNSFLVIVGDFDSDEMIAKVEKNFGHLPKSGIELPRLPQEPKQLGERRFEIRRAGMVDYLMTGWHIPESEHPDAYALEVLGNILGSGRTSRLYASLMDTGQCAQAMAWSSAFGYQDPFLFFTAAVVNPGVNPADVEQVIYDEIARIGEEGVTDEELNRAKKQARVAFVYEKDSIVSEAKALVDFELMSSWHDIDKYLPGVEAVSSEDIMRVAKTYLTRDNRTVGTYYAIQPEDSGVIPAGMSQLPDGQDGSVEQLGYHGFSKLPGQELAIAVAANSEGDVLVETLANGLTVVIKENHNNATINVHGLVRAGKIDDPVELPGVGSFTVGMLSSGTYNMSKLELAAAQENAGVELGFTPSRESFSFGGRSLTEDFGLLMDLLADQLLNSNFPEDEIEKMRRQTETGLRNAMQDTFEEAFISARSEIYGADHPFSGRVEGTLTSLAAISRDDLQAWYDANVIPAGAVLTIVGDIDAAEALAAVEARFGDWQGEDDGRSELLARGSEFAPVGGQRVDQQMADKSNVSLQWICPGQSKAEGDWAVRTLANFMYGGGFYSRLNERLRVREGLTYGAFSWYSNGLAAGPWCISAQVNPANVEQAILVADEELSRYVSEGVSEDELKLAQGYLTGNFPVKLSTNAAIAATLTDAVYLDRGLEFIDTYADRINAASLAEVNEFIGEHMRPEDCLLVVVGTI